MLEGHEEARAAETKVMMMTKATPPPPTTITTTRNEEKNMTTTNINNKKKRHKKNGLTDDELELSLRLPSSIRTAIQNGNFSSSSSKNLCINNVVGIIENSNSNCCNDDNLSSAVNANDGGTINANNCGGGTSTVQWLNPQAKREAQALRRQEARKKRDEKRKLSKLNCNSNYNYHQYYYYNFNGNANGNSGAKLRNSVIADTAASGGGGGGPVSVSEGAVAAVAGWYEKQRTIDRERREKEDYDGDSCRKGKNVGNVVGAEFSQKINSLNSASNSQVVAMGCVQVGNGGGGGEPGKLLPCLMGPFWGSSTGLVECENNCKNANNGNGIRPVNDGVQVQVAVGSGGGCGGFRPYQKEKKRKNGEMGDTLSNCSRSSSGISDHQCTSGQSGQGGSSSDTGSHSSHAHQPDQQPPTPTTGNAEVLPCPSPKNPKPNAFLGILLQNQHSNNYSSASYLQPESNQNQNNSKPTCSKPISPQKTTPIIDHHRSSPDKKPMSTNTRKSSPLPPKGDQHQSATSTSKPPKPPTSQNSQNALLLSQMPCVSTTGNGPNGKTITGILYSYTKTEVSIICVCHGISFSPAGFVEHAGGVDIAHPLKHITVVPFAFS